MQNRYTGDIGDFGKYGMLRELCKDRKLGIVWYLVPDETDKNDGNKIGYLDIDKESPTQLNIDRYRKCDPELYDKLREIVKSNNRNVTAIRDNHILPTNVFFENYVPQRERKKWLQEAHQCVQSCEIIFLDPDNGLQVKSRRAGSKKAPKYVFQDDLSDFKSSQSLIIYQHRWLYRPHEAQVTKQICELREKFGDRRIYALTYCPNPDKSEKKPDRIYYIILSKEDPLSHDELQRFCDEKWKGHFELRSNVV